jgi:hypothetical protein
MGAEYVESSSIQFRNMVAFDHTLAGIEIQTLANSQDVNSGLINTFYNESLGPLVSNSIIIGNSDSTKNYSITHTGLIVKLKIFIIVVIFC